MALHAYLAVAPYGPCRLRTVETGRARSFPPGRTPGGLIVHFRFDSLTDAGTAKLEVSVREGLVFAVRDALFDVSEFGIAPFSGPAVAEVELVAEKLRALVQRAKPRDLFDLRPATWSSRAGISIRPICGGRSTRSWR